MLIFCRFNNYIPFLRFVNVKIFLNFKKMLKMDKENLLS